MPPYPCRKVCSVCVGRVVLVVRVIGFPPPSHAFSVVQSVSIRWPTHPEDVPTPASLVPPWWKSIFLNPLPSPSFFDINWAFNSGQPNSLSATTVYWRLPPVKCHLPGVSIVYWQSALTGRLTIVWLAMIDWEWWAIDWQWLSIVYDCYGLIDLQRVHRM